MSGQRAIEILRELRELRENLLAKERVPNEIRKVKQEIAALELAIAAIAAMKF